MAVRKVVTRTGKGMRCLVPSLKMKRMIACESMLEADAVLLFEWSPDVMSFEEQPCFEFPHADGTPFRYTPDFLLRLVDGSEIYIEVKPARKLESPELRKRLNFVAEHFERSGRVFKILTEAVIRNGVVRENQKELNYHARPLPRDMAFWQTLDSLRSMPDLTFGATCAALGGRRAVMQLLGNRHLGFDQEQALAEDTPLSFLTEGGRRAAFQV